MYLLTQCRRSLISLEQPLVRFKHWSPTQLKGRKVAAQMWLQRQSKDPYVKRAREESFRCRSAFKLLEIDDKYDFLKPGQVVIDLGAAPGSWSQVAVNRVNALHVDRSQARGHVISVDISHMLALDGATVLPFSDFTDQNVQQKILRLLNEKSPTNFVRGNNEEFKKQVSGTSEKISDNITLDKNSLDKNSLDKNSLDKVSGNGLLDDVLLDKLSDSNSLDKNSLDKLSEKSLLDKNYIEKISQSESSIDKTSQSESSIDKTSQSKASIDKTTQSESSIPHTTRQRRADVIISDMAPNASGIKSHDHVRLIQLSAAVVRFSMVGLEEGGTCLMKVWRGAELERLVGVMGRCFSMVEQVKPPSSRVDSAEIFILGRGFHL